MFRFLAIPVIFVLLSGVVSASGLSVSFSNLPLLPEQKPSFDVNLVNTSLKPFSGTIRLEVPAGWRVIPENQSIALAAGEQKRLSFTIAHGKANAENIYTLAALLEPDAREAGGAFKHTQQIRVTSAPNGRPTDEKRWADAIPISWDNIHISTLWNKKQFCFLIGIEKMQLQTGEFPTAVQLAIGAVKADRSYGALHQFLVFAEDDNNARLVALTGEPLTDSIIKIFYEADTLWFEGAIDFQSLSGIKPGEGRELTFSVLIHDPVEKKVYDWGKECLVSQEDAAPNTNEIGEKWIRWKGNSIFQASLSLPRTLWSLCSSKY